MTSTDLYIEFFGFTERPFTLLPDPDFLFWSRAHRRAYSVLEYGMMTRSPRMIAPIKLPGGNRISDSGTPA